MSDALTFLRLALVTSVGEFGWRNHVVDVIDDAVVAVGACYGEDTKWTFRPAAARQSFSYCGARHAAGVIACGWRMESVISPPSGAKHYLAHLGIFRGCRGHRLATPAEFAAGRCAES